MAFHIISGTDRLFMGKLALFDVDGTLVVSKSGKRWASEKDDWIWSQPSVPSVLHKLYSDGWTIALITNQSEWSKSKYPQEKLEHILESMEDLHGWHPWCLVATAMVKAKDSVYRKPSRGLFDKLLENLKITSDDIVSLQMCGDASGDEYPSYRWSDSDRRFAETIGANFILPRDIFESRPIESSDTKEIVLLMGNPGSGKSSTARLLVSSGYIHLEQDIIGTKEKALKKAKELVTESNSIIIDATHGSSKNRDPYLDLARKHNIPIRIIWHVRDGRPFNALREKPVPEVAYAVYTKHFVDPRSDDVNIEFI